MILTNYFINKKIKKLAKQSLKRPHSFRSLNDVKSVLVMCEAKDWKSVGLCVDKLKSLKKTVNVCVYIRKNEDTPIWDYAYLLLEESKDMNIWGFPDKNIPLQLNTLSVDLLIDLTDERTQVMRYLMLQHPASFKVGAKRSHGVDMYDFSIVMKDNLYDIPFLFTHILSYLESIRSK